MNRKKGRKQWFYICHKTKIDDVDIKSTTKMLMMAPIFVFGFMLRHGGCLLNSTTNIR